MILSIAPEIRFGVMNATVNFRLEAALLLNLHGVDAFSVTVQKADESKIIGDAAQESHWRRMGLEILDIALLGRSDIYVLPRRVWPKQRRAARKQGRTRAKYRVRHFARSDDTSNHVCSGFDPTISGSKSECVS